MHLFLINRNTMLSSWGSQKYRIIYVGKDLWRSLSLTSCLGKAYIRFLRALPRLIMIISDYEESQSLRHPPHSLFDHLHGTKSSFLFLVRISQAQPVSSFSNLSNQRRVQLDSWRSRNSTFYSPFSWKNLFLTTSLCTSVLHPLMLMPFHGPHCRRFILLCGVQDQGQYPRCGLTNARCQSFLLTS